MARKRRQQKPPAPPPLNGAALAAAPPDPDSGRGPGNLLAMLQHQAGMRVNEDTALTLGAVFACVRVISEGLACLPFPVLESLATGGSRLVPDDPADWVLGFQANPETSAFTWRETMVAHALLWGNGYSEIELDLAGRVVWLHQLTPDRVRVERGEGGRIVYRVHNPQAEDTLLPPEAVFHLKGLGWDGLSGYSVVRLAARVIGVGIALDESSATMFGHDSTPGGVLQHPGRLTEKARETLRESWQRRHGGPSNRRTVAVLEEGLTWQQTGLSPEDLQMLQQRQYTPAEICRWFRVQPHKVADLSRATFSNIEQQSIEHVTDTLMPWARRLESEANIKLFGRNTRRRRFARIDFRAIMRGDSASRATYITQMLGNGVLSLDEAREEEGFNPIPDGDLRLVPLNMQTVETAAAGPPEPPPAPGPGAKPPGGAAEPGDSEGEDDLSRRRLYSDKQPRAKDGKFGEGGGDSGGDSKGAEGPQWPVANVKKADAWGKANVVTEGGLSKDERDALGEYRKGSDDINGSLRAGKPSDSGQTEHEIRQIDAAMLRSEVKADVVVLRGLSHADAAGAFEPGKLYLDRGFISTTLHEGTAERFTTEVSCEIMVPAGSRGIYQRQMGEAELILDRGSMFKVRSVDLVKGVVQVRMTLVSQGATFGDDRGRKKQAARPGTRLQPEEDRDENGGESDLARFSWKEGDLEEQELRPVPRPGLAAAFVPVLAEALGRCARRDAHRLEDARRRLGEEGLPAWLAETAQERRAHAAEALTPGVLALAKLAGGTDAVAAVALATFLDAGGTEAADLAARVLAACAAGGP